MSLDVELAHVRERATHSHAAALLDARTPPMGRVLLVALCLAGILVLLVQRHESLRWIALGMVLARCAVWQLRFPGDAERAWAELRQRTEGGDAYRRAAQSATWLAAWGTFAAAGVLLTVTYVHWVGRMLSSGEVQSVPLTGLVFGVALIWFGGWILWRLLDGWAGPVVLATLLVGWAVLLRMFTHG